jgi:hypothetical protein
MSKEIVFKNEILRGVVGSTAHGLNIVGEDDIDEMGVFIEPPEYVCGLRSLDHYIKRDQPEGVRAKPGDLEVTMYSLRKFCGLAAKGNPSVLVLLWLPEHQMKSKLGRELVWLRDKFISHEMGERFLGYLTSQKLRLEGKLSKKVQRPDLVEKYGYDTKFAGHAVRLGFEGLELLTDRKLTLPMKQHERDYVREVRTGKHPLPEVLEQIESLQGALRNLIEKRKDWKADIQGINNFLVKAHREHWQ